MRPTAGTVIRGGNGTVPRGHAAVTRGIHTVIGMLGTVALREMDFLILGPLEVRDGSEPIALPAREQRGLLALLLLHRNEVLGSERLIDALWGESPPPTAAKALQNAVSRCAGRWASDGGRCAPSAAATCCGRAGRAGRRPLRAAPRGGPRGARRRRRTRRRRSGCARRSRSGAARRSRISPTSAFAQPEIARLEDERLAALEDRIEADLALGRHAELVPELEAEVGAPPAARAPPRPAHDRALPRGPPGRGARGVP